MLKPWPLFACIFPLWCFFNHAVHALVSRNSGNESNEAMTQEGTLDKMIIPVASLINVVFHICRYLYLEMCAII